MHGIKVGALIITLIFLQLLRGQRPIRRVEDGTPARALVVHRGCMESSAGLMSRSRRKYHKRKFVKVIGAGQVVSVLDTTAVLSHLERRQRLDPWFRKHNAHSKLCHAQGTTETFAQLFPHEDWGGRETTCLFLATV